MGRASVEGEGAVGVATPGRESTSIHTKVEKVDATVRVLPLLMAESSLRTGISIEGTPKFEAFADMGGFCQLLDIT